MPKITIKQAKKFLDNITEKDKIAIIHHDDADGICSGIILHDHCLEKKAIVKTFAYIISKTNLEKLNLNSFNKIIITDVSTKDIKESIKSIKKKQVLVIDHHPKNPLPKEILYLETTSQGYIPVSKTTYEIIKKKKWLALIGTIADSADLYKENDKFIKETLKELNLTLDEFKTKYAHIFSNTIIYFANKPNKIFPLLSKLNSLQEISKLKKYANTVKKEIQKYVKEYKRKMEKIENINMYHFNPKFQIKGIIIAIISKQHPKEIFIFTSKKNSDKNMLGISARHQSKNANLVKLLKYATKNLKNSASGGHPRASGGTIQAKDLEKFKQNLKEYISKNKK